MIRRQTLLPAAALLLAACAEAATIAGPSAVSAVDPDDPAWVAAAEPCTPQSPALSLPADRRLPPPANGRFDTPDDVWARAAREVPGGWGGLLYAEGRLTIYLVDPARRDAAVSALERLLAGTGHARVIPELRGAAVRRGRWDFAQMYDWYRYLDQSVWQVGGVTSSDIDEAANRITYGVWTRTRASGWSGTCAPSTFPATWSPSSSARPSRSADSTAFDPMRSNGVDGEKQLR